MGDRNFNIQNETTHMPNGSDVANNYTHHDNGIYTEFDFYFHGIVLPIISLFGLIGNSISSVILFQIAKSSFYMYLAFLSLSDIAALAFGLAVFFIELTSEDPVQITCSPIEACLRTFSHLSSWITVSVTVDRYIAVCHPFKVTQYCSRKRALFTIGAVFLVIVALNFPIACLQWDDAYSTCLVPEFTNDYCFKYGFYIDMSVYVLIPFSLIGFLNIFIIREIFRSTSRRRHLTSGTNENSGSSTANIKNSTMKTVTMLFTVTAFFIVCFLPFIGISLFAIVNGKSWDSAMELIPIPFTIAIIGTTLNHSFNFVLYGLSGQLFRKRFLEMFCFRRCVQS
ncbi:probable G-protein coupled receptor 139 [Pecten maximus]|uniref:probable G-protein coupled receptor 139 n=1 Tax=Pecten maximus TaxID=6579 RepID=UPI001458EAEF|nr:probable G-protein coupled receptor 139 [Pecten maximus]